MPEPQNRPSKKILIIDDEANFRYLLKENLKSTGKFKVLEAKGGSMGAWLASCRWHRPDAILLDLMMPGMDGFEFLKIVKESPETRNIPVIVITGKSDDESKARAEALGCDDYIVKPAEFNDLLSRIEQAMTRRKSATQ